MPAYSVFCSHCGCAQTAQAASGQFYLRCFSCEAWTIVLGTNWRDLESNPKPTMPLLPSIAFRETELACASCEASLNLEWIVRSHGEPCVRCADFGDISEAKVDPPNAVARLTADELSFLSGEEVS